MNNNLAVRWEDMPGDTPILNRHILCPVFQPLAGREAGPGGAVLNRHASHAALGVERKPLGGKEALGLYRLAVETNVLNGLDYQSALTLVNRLHPGLVDAMRNKAAVAVDAGRSEEDQAMDAFFEKVKALKAKHGAAMSWGQAWLMTVEKHRGEYEAAGKPQVESALSNYGHQSWER